MFQFIGIDTLTKSHFKKIVDKQGKPLRYVRNKFQKSKNFQKESQDINSGGVITFEANDLGLNSGRYLELYMQTLNPGNKNLFQRPKYGKKFRKRIHKDNKLKILYVNRKVGKVLVGKMMPKVNKYKTTKTFFGRYT